MVVGKLEIYIPLADLVDKNAELARLQKEIDKLKRDQEKLAGALRKYRLYRKSPACRRGKRAAKLPANYQHFK